MLNISILVFLALFEIYGSCEKRESHIKQKLPVERVFDKTVISARSWGTNSVDVFGIALNGSVWHKYNRGQGWQPPGLYFENMNTSAAISKPTVISSQPNRMDFLYITKNRNVHLRYWLGSDWNPPAPEDLGGNFSSPITAASWAPDRINIVGRGADMGYRHSFWDSVRWRPSGPLRASNDVWEDLGGNFNGPAALASWDVHRMAIFGISHKGALKCKYWDGEEWVPSGTRWDEISPGPFISSPAASSWGPGRLDVWAVGEDTNLYHKFWDAGSSSNWENLGGKFLTVPQVIHWGPGRADVVGRFADQSRGYFHKFWNGSQWNPPAQKWDEKHGDFSSQAAVASSGVNCLSIFGVDSDGLLKLQMWNGSQWWPSSNTWFSLGSTRYPFQEPHGVREEEL